VTWLAIVSNDHFIDSRWKKRSSLRSGSKFTLGHTRYPNVRRWWLSLRVKMVVCMKILRTSI